MHTHIYTLSLTIYLGQFIYVSLYVKIYTLKYIIYIFEIIMDYIFKMNIHIFFLFV